MLETDDKYTEVEDVKGAEESELIIAQAIEEYEKTYGNSNK